MKIIVDGGTQSLGAIMLESDGRGCTIHVQGGSGDEVVVAPGLIEEFCRAVLLLTHEARKQEGRE